MQDGAWNDEIETKPPDPGELDETLTTPVEPITSIIIKKVKPKVSKTIGELVPTPDSSMGALSYIAPITQHSPKHPYVIVCTDGGSRDKHRLAATGWISYSSDWNINSCHGMCLPQGTNNDAEFRAALEGLTYITNTVSNHTIIHLTDSSMVERALMGTIELTSSRHRITTRSIQHLQGRNGNRIVTFQVPRRFNTGADRLCNISMDNMRNSYKDDMTSCDLLKDNETTRGLFETFILPRISTSNQLNLSIRETRWNNVMRELLFMNGPTPLISTPACIPPGGDPFSKGSVFAGKTGFETHPFGFIVDGKKRSVPKKVYERLRDVCKKHSIPWHKNAFYIPGDTSTEPTQDIRILTAICKAVNNDVTKVIRLMRGQTEDDGRPSKHLRPELYKEHLKDYPGLMDLCQISLYGFVSRAPDFVPPRPPPINHLSARERAPAVQRRLFKEAYLRRTLIMDSEQVLAHPGVNPMPFAVAPKKNVDYTKDGRLIHDASFPKGKSLNDAVPSEKLDAKTDDVIDIARRVIDLYRTYPNTPIHGMVADVDSAFHNAPASESTSLLFSGQIPGSSLMSIALTAIFGYTDSPGIFAIFAKAAQFYHHNAPGAKTYWNWLWVDDFVCIEPDVGPILRDSEARLRASFHLVFGTPGWNDEKYIPWANNFHAVGMDWDLANGTVSIPKPKIEKARVKIQDCLNSCLDRTPPTLREWRSLVGTLRHVSQCIPGAKPFFQRFVSTEKLLVAKGLPSWDDLVCDLEWFGHVLDTSHLNGVTVERFATTSDRVELIYMGWNKRTSYIIDFSKECIISQLTGGPIAAATLLEWYLYQHKMIPNAFGPHRRTDTLIHVSCQTSHHARKLNNWGLPGLSLRTLGWHCVQQHIQIAFSGPSLGTVNMSHNTNLLLQVLDSNKSLSTKKVFFCPLWKSKRKLSNETDSPRQVGPLTRVNLKHGVTFATSPISLWKHSTCNPSTNKTESSPSSRPTAVTDMPTDLACARKLSKTYDSRQSKLTTRKDTTIKLLKARAWKWLSKVTNVPSHPTGNNAYHLVLPCSENSDCSFLPMDLQNPSSYGGAHSSDSLHLPVLEKYGVQNRNGRMGKRLEPTTSCDGEISPMEKEILSRVELIKVQHGSMSTLNHRKGTGTKKESRYDSRKPTIRKSVQYEPFGISNVVEKCFDSKTIPRALFPIQEMVPYTDPPSQRSSNGLPKKTELTPNVSPITQSASEGPPNSWLPVLAKPLSSWLEDGSHSVIKSIYG